MTNPSLPSGIHGGRTGDADHLFLQNGCIALGWAKIPTSAPRRPTATAFKAQFAGAYPDYKPAAIPGAAGQLFRFVHEMQVGDLVVYPSKADRQVHIGEVTLPYAFDCKREPGYPHQRAVKWRSHVPRTHFSQGALYEIGSALSFFQVKNYADEYRLALTGKKIAPLVGEDAATVRASQRTSRPTARLHPQAAGPDAQG